MNLDEKYLIEDVMKYIFKRYPYGKLHIGRIRDDAG